MHGGLRPSPRGVLIFAAGVPVSIVLVSLLPWAWVVPLDYALLVLLAMAVDALACAPVVGVQIGLDVPERLYLGEHGAIGVSVQALGRRFGLGLEALAEVTGTLDPPVAGVVRLGPGEGARLDLALMPRRRGRLRVVRLWLRWGGPLGLVRRVHRLEVGRDIDVLPSIRAVRDATVRFHAREAVFGMRVQRERGEGSEFDALKEYVPGMDSRAIDWTRSARHQKLICKEFKIERNHPIVLAFDTGHLMLEPIEGVPRLDHAISAGLLLAWIALRGGDLVGLYGFDSRVRQFTAPVRGMAGIGALQRAAAGLDYHYEETNFTLGLAELGQRLRRRALVVLFTDFTDTVSAELLVESIRRVAQRHVVVFACLRDPLLGTMMDRAPERFEHVAEAVVAADFERDRRIVLERLGRMGVQCLDVPREAFPVGLLNRYLMVKERGLL